MPTKQGRRTIFTADARLKYAKAAAPTPEKIGTLTGYALVWNELSTDRGGYKVRLMPGSARFTPNVHALWHHDFSRPLADTESKTLRITTDDIGVKVEIDLPDTTTGRDAEELVESKRVRGMSFAMVDGIEAGNPVREAGQEILNATGYTVDEVTITCIPAFPGTTIAVSEDDVPEEEDAAGYAETRRQAMKFEQSRHDLYRPPLAA